MGVTDLLPYFTQIIGHNSVNVHRIPTKLGTEICLNEPFKCAKFQPDPNTHSCFIADFAKWPALEFLLLVFFFTAERRKASRAAEYIGYIYFYNIAMLYESYYYYYYY